MKLTNYLYDTAVEINFKGAINVWRIKSWINKKPKKTAKNETFIVLPNNTFSIKKAVAEIL